ncbi:hypothetical protein D3C84_782410 [compost metagenome]
MIVGDDFGRMAQSADNTGRLPLADLVVLYHDSQIEPAVVMLKQRDSSLNDVGVPFLHRQQCFVESLESRITSNSLAYLELIGGKFGA